MARVRAVALALALTFATTSGLLFVTQGGAQAYAVAPKRVVTMLPGMARALSGISPWGRGVLTALELASMFGKNPLTDLVPGTNGKTPNDDQPQTASGGTGTWTRGGLNFTTTMRPAASGRAGKLDVTLAVSGSSNPGTSCQLEYLDSGGVWRLFTGWSCWQGQTVNNGPNTQKDMGPLPAGVTQCRGAEYNAGTFVIASGAFSCQTTYSRGNPQRRLRAYSDCADAAGGNAVRAYGSWVLFTEGSGYPPITAPACPEGSPYRVGFGADAEVLDAGTNTYGNRYPVVPPLTRPTTPAAYPKILPDSPLRGLPAPLPGPQVAPDGTTKAEPEPLPDGSYCAWGTYNVPPDQCTDPDVPVPGPTSSPIPSPAASPAAPASPVPVVEQSPVPENCAPGSKSAGTIGCSPTTGTQPVPAEGCLEAGWSWNPLSWVYAPVKCALRWAFVPSQAEVDAARVRVDDALGGVKTAGKWAGVFTSSAGALGGLNDSGGCAGPVFTLRFGASEAEQMRPFDACEDPMRKAAVGVKLFLSLITVVVGVRVCAKPVLAALGMGGAV